MFGANPMAFRTALQRRLMPQQFSAPAGGAIASSIQQMQGGQPQKAGGVMPQIDPMQMKRNMGLPTRSGGFR